jgi:hypothetical protein
LELGSLGLWFLHRLKSWVKVALMDVNHSRHWHLNQGWNCHELKSMHSLELDWGGLWFLHQLKSWVTVALMDVNHSRHWHLNQGRNCHELETRHSTKLHWLRSFFLDQSNCFAGCRSLSSVTFEPGSKLSMVEKRALLQSGLGGRILRTSIEETSNTKEWVFLSKITINITTSEQLMWIEYRTRFDRSGITIGIRVMRMREENVTE